MFNEMSDEVKLEMIKSDLAKITYGVKMLMITQSTLETYRQVKQDDVPEDLKDFVNSKSFMESFYKAISASGETINNLLIAIDSISMLYGIEFRTTLPTNAEEFRKLIEEMRTESLRLAAAERNSTGGNE